jgi:hypothetical protein
VPFLLLLLEVNSSRLFLEGKEEEEEETLLEAFQSSNTTLGRKLS